ncbi:hypothetical protein RCL_jg27834.t1 [Rhizophagus clarus]|uniref:Uncharacterized protein n=1 Tax=Rhizophagus clarus TaxID=94130 RepID=A0A8H3LC42_9GLOM|nr:hypothetical protein RCL_jg27834.t1 [Rhizophagus clarus]
MVRKELFCPSFANLSTISFSDILENVLCMFHVSDYCSFCGPLRSSYDLNAGTMLRAKIKDMSISDVGRFVLSILRFDLRLFVENPYLEGFARLSTLDGVPKMGEFIEPLCGNQGMSSLSVMSIALALTKQKRSYDNQISIHSSMPSCLDVAERNEIE